MNDNTILRIKVPAHLYESVKEQLSLTEAKKQNYGAGYSVVKEKKMKVPKDGMKKVEEGGGYMGTEYDSSEDMAVSMIKKETKDTDMEKKSRTLDELKAAKDKLNKKIQEMEGGNENFNEDKNMSYQEIADKAIKDALKYGNTNQSKLDILTSLKNRIAKNIEGMSSKDKVEENINEYIGMSPDQAQAVEVLGSLIAAGGLSLAVKTALQVALDKLKTKK